MEKYTFLSEQERLLVEAFYKNETQRDAVKKVLLNGIYNNGVISAGGKHNGNENWVYGLPWKADGQNTVSNEKLGEQVRAIAEAIKNIEIVFLHELPKFGVKLEVKEKKNPAR